MPSLAEIDKSDGSGSSRDCLHLVRRHLSVVVNAQGSLSVTLRSNDEEPHHLLSLALSQATSFSSVIVDARSAVTVDSSMLSTLLKYSPSAQNILVTTQAGLDRVCGTKLVNQDGNPTTDRFRWKIATTLPDTEGVDTERTREFEYQLLGAYQAPTPRSVGAQFQAQPSAPTISHLTTYTSSDAGIVFSINHSIRGDDALEELGKTLRDTSRFPLTTSCTIDLSAIESTDMKVCGVVLMALQARHRLRESMGDSSDGSAPSTQLVVPACFERLFPTHIAARYGFAIRVAASN